METSSAGRHEQPAEDEPTLVQPPLLAHPWPGTQRDQRGTLITEDNGRTEDFSNDLLRLRLCAACVFMSATFAAALVWRALIGWSVLLWRSAAVLAAVQAAAAVALQFKRSERISTAQLRKLEIAMFGLSVAYLAAQQDYAVTRRAGQGVSTSVLAATDVSLDGSILLMLLYGMLIPNTARRAAVMVLAIALVPLTTLSLRFITNPGVFQSVREVMTPGRLGATTLSALAAAALTIYGAHAVQSLRGQVRRLDRYRLGRKIGAGGMGEVFLAEHHLLKRPCALKLIRREAAGDPATLARFEREVHATAQLTHPNTIEIFDYGRSDDGRLYYVMEYLRGMDLAAIVSRHGLLPPGRVVYLMRQVCGALAEAHEAGIIHRDLKPANVFVTRLGGIPDFVKILDFGLARTTGVAGDPYPSRQGKVRGTPSYMAPEQVLGSLSLDHRADIYALGCVAYFLLTGRPPFDEGGRVEVMISHVRDPVIAPSTLRKGIPADLEHVVMLCLAKSAADRPANARTLECALASCACSADWDIQAAERWWDLNVVRGDTWTGKPVPANAGTSSGERKNQGQDQDSRERHAE